jgi:hypothetical protein
MLSEAGVMFQLQQGQMLGKPFSEYTYRLLLPIGGAKRDAVSGALFGSAAWV